MTARPGGLIVTARPGGLILTHQRCDCSVFEHSAGHLVTQGDTSSSCFSAFVFVTCSSPSDLPLSLFLPD